MKKSTVRKHGGRLIQSLIDIDSKSVNTGKKSKEKCSTTSQSVHLAKRGVKRVVRNKSSHSVMKPKHMNQKVQKTVHSKKRMVKVEVTSEDGDSQANKENDAPCMPQKTTKIGKKKSPFVKTKVEVVKVQQSIIDEPMATPDSKTSRHHKRKMMEEGGESAKTLKNADRSSSKKKSEKFTSSTKRVSLRKKMESVSEASAFKQEVPETPKQKPESDIKSSSFEHPKNNYGLRKRGRKPKKSRIYEDKDNIIFSHEKEEEMHKIGDSEFKLPHEERNKLMNSHHTDLNLEASVIDEDSYKDTLSRHNIIDHDMSDDGETGKNKI
jgi:hypothetical protein